MTEPSIHDEPRTASGLLRVSAVRSPEDVATFHRSHVGRWVSTTWASLWNDVQRTASAFHRLGLEPGARLAIMARTRREWQLAELAAYEVGAVVVGIDPHAAPEQALWMLDHAGACGLVVETVELLARIPPGDRRRLRFVLVLDDRSVCGETSVQRWADALAAESDRLTAPRTPPAPDAVATIVYTSGTTGNPRGIAYSHAQVMAGCRAILDLMPELSRPNRLMCWLPMAALFQRMINLVAIAGGSTTYFVDDPRDIIAHLAEVRPTAFAAVPRFYEKLHDGIQQRIAEQADWQRAIVRMALETGSEWAFCQRRGDLPSWPLRMRHALFDRLVLRRLRSVMGGHLTWMMSGSAAAPAWLLEFYHAIGLLVLEAYGVTENPVPIAANRPHAYRFGSVGRPLSINDVRVDEHGEILVKGPAMFREYHRDGRPDDRFTGDGYYRTGDYGRLDEDGFLFLVGRTSEIIKTSTGRRISPAAVEAVYLRSEVIDQVVVMGNDRPYLVALVTLHVPAVQAALRRGGHAPVSYGDLPASSAVAAIVREELDRLGHGLSRHERIRNFAILASTFSVQTGEVTATLKFRRRVIEVRYRELIDALYCRSSSNASMPRASRERADLAGVGR